MEFTSAYKRTVIYIFRINDEEHKGLLKIGKTSYENTGDNYSPNSSELNKIAKNRINQITKTAGITYELLYSEEAIFKNKENKIKQFTDNDIHKVLKNSGINPVEIAGSREWFEVDLETAKNAIEAVKEGRKFLDNSEISNDKSPVEFRKEQIIAIEKTVNRFKDIHAHNDMLWFAKMRFGKTLSALEVIKRMNFDKTIIITHRPVIKESWKDDFFKIFYDNDAFQYIMDDNLLKEQLNNTGKKIIYFASIQDLRGSNEVGGNFDKNQTIFATEWDCLIVDEAHEGTQTELGLNITKNLKKKHTKTLLLSGTPYNLIKENHNPEDIFIWDYIMEQKQKELYNNEGVYNAYSVLPKMNIYTFNLSDEFKLFTDTEAAFNFKEFFRTKNDGGFIHKKDITQFLDLLTTNENYPFSKPEFRNNFRHTLWMVPGVKEAKALSSVLKSHPIFSQFNIANVAGDGDEEAANDDAMNLVKTAITEIPEEAFSITLSCGRLTTGVTVKEWTAVLMLAGTYSTSAASYMQTIFRVQSPSEINGMTKEECFVFDFAPDRTLKVLAEAAKSTAQAINKEQTDEKILGEFTNFCPIIAIKGNRMQEFNASKLLEELKKVYIERVINNGFEDKYIYNSEKLRTLNEEELKKFEKMQKIIGSTKAHKKTTEIDINNQGFTEEQHEEIQKIKSKKKAELTDEDKMALKEAEEKKKNIDRAISILRGISIRMPLMLYGAELTDETEEITIDNFTEKIDDLSWSEFMPHGVTKQDFQEFVVFYDNDIFRAAGRRIREMVRSADKLSVEDRIERLTQIFSTFRNPDKETVLTPWRVVNMHLGDCLGGWVFFDEDMENPITMPRFVDQGTITSNVFSMDSKILELNSKSGLYPLYLTYTLYRKEIEKNKSLADSEDLLAEQQKIWDKILSENIFVICKSEMAKAITKRTLVGFRNADVNARYFKDLVNQITKKQDNFINKLHDSKKYWKINLNQPMKFNAIVGNPPYQVMDGGGTGDSSKPVYNKFIEISFKFKPNVWSFIFPSRWMKGGKGLDEFRNKMMDSVQIKKIFDYQNAKHLFNNINIDGGICYVLWEKDHNGPVDYTYITEHNEKIRDKRYLKLESLTNIIRDSRQITIVNKFKEIPSKFSAIVSSRKPYGIATDLFNNPSKYSYEAIPTCAFKNSLKIYGVFGNKGGAKRRIGFIDKSLVSDNGSINKWKLLHSYAYTTEATVPPEIILAGPFECCTETFLQIGSFEQELEAINCLKYVKTKTFRGLLSFNRSQKNISKSTFNLIPLQDFTPQSDIDWSKSVAEIDQQLYKKYELTEEEIAFIESKIKPMS